MTFTALGLSDTGNVELHNCENQTSCRVWIENYTKNGNWGGYYGISILSPDGCYLETFSAPEAEE
jgi:hypothetical protein